MPQRKERTWNCGSWWIPGIASANKRRGARAKEAREFWRDYTKAYRAGRRGRERILPQATRISNGPRTKVFGDGDATRRHPRRNCGKNAPDGVTRQVVRITLMIIKEERERWTVVCTPVNLSGNYCHEEIAAIGTRVHSLNHIKIGDSGRTKKKCEMLTL